jgi:hypothetical protein
MLVEFPGFLHLPRVVRMDIENGLFQVSQKGGIYLLGRGVQGLMPHAHLPRRQFDFVESLREFQERSIPFFLHLGHDLPHGSHDIARNQILPALEAGENLGLVFFLKDANHISTFG